VIHLTFNNGKALDWICNTFSCWIYKFYIEHAEIQVNIRVLVSKFTIFTKNHTSNICGQDYRT
jgi:hypothetical protein